mgnify:FL=1|jgi:ATP-dependent DNA helicase DinG|tara:strand:+ start:239 stop:3250 length:3012 start_codon:yes stop_codon:yes gene_type:complete
MTNNFNFAISHIHTTGPHTERDFIIQLGLLPLDGTKEPGIEKFKPECKISRSAKQRSGLKDSILENAPLFGAVSSKWQSELEKFSHIFVMKSGNGNELDWVREVVLKNSPQTVVVDLSLVIQFFLPDFDDYSLEGMYKSVFGRELPKTEDIMKETLLLFEALLRRVAELFSRKDTVFHTHLQDILQTIIANPDFEAISHLIQGCNSSGWLDGDLLINPNKRHGSINIADFKGKDLIPEILTDDTSKVGTFFNHDSVIKKINTSTVKNFFTSKFIRESLKSYEIRNEQIEFSANVVDMLDQPVHHYVEAPTGIGKTLGYLVPAAFYLEKNKTHKIMIATSTKNLQAQILEKDWPLIIKRFQDVSITTLKGKSNYICPTALARQFSHSFNAEADWQEKAAWIYLALFSYETEGDLEKIPYRMKKWLIPLYDLLKDVRSDLHCTKSLCKPANCVYGRHLNAAKRSNIVVTNHHKAVSLDQEILGSTHAIIVDEADRFGDNVRQALSIEIRSMDVDRLIHRLIGTSKRRGYLQVLKEKIEENVKGRNRKNAAKTLEDIEALIGNVGLYNKSIQLFIEKIHPANGYIPSLMVKLPALRNSTSSLKLLMDPILVMLEIIENSLTELQDENSPLNSSQKERCESYRVLIENISGSFKDFSFGFGTLSYAHSYSGSPESWTLTRMPVYLHDSLKKSIYENIDNVFFTSAALYIQDSPEFFIDEYGSRAKGFNVNTLRLNSPFSYRDHVYCAVDTSIPSYDYKNPFQMQAFRSSVDQAIMTYGLATNGRTLILFMSTEEMNQTYDRTKAFFRNYDILPILQNGSSLEEIKEFYRNEYSILFGVDRFWSGVDFPGPTLSQVIIVKAPNPSLSNTIIAHRNMWETDFMARVYSSSAYLKLRQGFGRLIRSMKDRGGVVILDSRYEWNPYFQGHLLGIPATVTFCQDQEQIMRSVLASAKLASEFRQRRIDPFLEVRNNLPAIEKLSSIVNQVKDTKNLGYEGIGLKKKLIKSKN